MTKELPPHRHQLVAWLQYNAPHLVGHFDKYEELEAIFADTPPEHGTGPLP